MTRIARLMLASVWLLLWPSVPGAQVWNRYLEGYHGPYRGRVIDAETKQPLAGAAVVAVWSREQFQLFRTATIFYEAKEVLTDANGQFVLHAKEIEQNAPAKTLRPTFVVFFPGYGSYPNRQVAPRGFLGGIFEGKGATVELPRLKTREERLDHLSRMVTPSGRYDVPFRKTPHFIELLNRERVSLGLEPSYYDKGENQ